MLRNTPYGAGATPEAITAADAAIAALKAGEPIYEGTLKDNAGNVVIDKAYDNYDPVPRRHELPARGRAGLDHLIDELAASAARVHVVLRSRTEVAAFRAGPHPWRRLTAVNEPP